MIIFTLIDRYLTAAQFLNFPLWSLLKERWKEIGLNVEGSGHEVSASKQKHILYPLPSWDTALELTSLMKALSMSGEHPDVFES